MAAWYNKLVLCFLLFVHLYKPQVGFMTIKNNYSNGGISYVEFFLPFWQHSLWQIFHSSLKILHCFLKQSSVLTDAVCTNVKCDIKSKREKNVISKVGRNPIWCCSISHPIYTGINTLAFMLGTLHFTLIMKDLSLLEQWFKVSCSLFH